jgi:hypothetical protein
MKFMWFKDFGLGLNCVTTIKNDAKIVQVCTKHYYKMWM